jgi:hypothetical protein
MLYLERISVECYAGYRAEESPRAFSYKGRAYLVLEIMDRWYEGGLKAEAPIINYFKVRADDGKEYLLRCDPGEGRWFLALRR